MTNSSTYLHIAEVPLEFFDAGEELGVHLRHLRLQHGDGRRRTVKISQKSVKIWGKH